MPSPSALCKQLTFLEMASFWHSPGSRITRKAWLTWIETKRGYFDDMVAVSFFENFELIYWFLDVPQMTIHLNTSQPSGKERMCSYCTHHISSHHARLKVPSFLFGDFKRHFSTNRSTLNRDRAKLLNLWGPTKIFASQTGFNSALQYGKTMENFTQIVSCHFISNSMLLPGDAFSHSGDPGIFHGLPSQRGAGARPPSYCLPLLTNVVSSRFCA